MADPALAGIARALLVREAVASTAMEHPQDCACPVCRAARGDVDAFAQIMVMVDEATERGAE